MSCKLNVILDLDNTLINSIFNSQEISLIPNDARIPSKNMRLDGDLFKTYKRPHLDKFLDYLFKNFNVGIFTAGIKSYADQIVWNFIQDVPGRKIDFILHREDLFKASKQYGGMKNLKYLWDFLKFYDYYPCNTILIDDHKNVHETNLVNTIKIEPFNLISGDSFNQSSLNDDVLIKVMSTLDKMKNRYYKSECNISKQNTRCPDVNDDIYFIYPEYEDIITNKMSKPPVFRPIFEEERPTTPMISQILSGNVMKPSPFRTIPTQPQTMDPTISKPLVRSPTTADLSSAFSPLKSLYDRPSGGSVGKEFYSNLWY